MAFDLLVVHPGGAAPRGLLDGLAVGVVLVAW
jgi:hypothetical protein